MYTWAANNIMFDKFIGFSLIVCPMIWNAVLRFTPRRAAAFKAAVPAGAVLAFETPRVLVAVEGVEGGVVRGCAGWKWNAREGREKKKAVFILVRLKGLLVLLMIVKCLSK
jgi:hypothetical protein